MSSFLQSLASFISPSEAEAKVIPKDREAESLVNFMGSAPYSDYKGIAPNLWKYIYDKAHALDTEVELYAGSPLTDPDTDPQTSGYFQSRGRLKKLGEDDTRARVFLKPLSEQDKLFANGSVRNQEIAGNESYSRRQTLSHELLHFLISDYTQKNTSLKDTERLFLIKNEHPIIQYILGNVSANKLLGYYHNDLYPEGSRKAAIQPFDPRFNPNNELTNIKLISDFLKSTLPEWYPNIPEMEEPVRVKEQPKLSQPKKGKK